MFHFNIIILTMSYNCDINVAIDSLECRFPNNLTSIGSEELLDCLSDQILTWNDSTIKWSYNWLHLEILCKRMLSGSVIPCHQNRGVNHVVQPYFTKQASNSKQCYSTPLLITCRHLVLRVVVISCKHLSTSPHTMSITFLCSILM